MTAAALAAPSTTVPHRTVYHGPRPDWTVRRLRVADDPAGIGTYRTHWEITGPHAPTPEDLELLFTTPDGVFDCGVRVRVTSTASLHHTARAVYVDLDGRELGPDPTVPPTTFTYRRVTVAVDHP